MRKFGSFLVILLLITAYGRCVADQFGVLHTSDTACCQTVCCDDNHCEPSETDEPSETHPCESPSDHDSSPEDTAPPTDDEPDPCQLCLILSNDSMLLSDSVKVPSPILIEIHPLYFITTWNTRNTRNTWNNQLQKILSPIDLEQLPDEHPDRPTEHRSQLRRIIAKTTPVRGPSIV